VTREFPQWVDAVEERFLGVLPAILIQNERRKRKHARLASWTDLTHGRIGISCNELGFIVLRPETVLVG
jgi:hypothetical protein